MATTSAGSIKQALDSVRTRITKAYVEKKSSHPSRKEVRLVAVSKTKPPEAILEAYKHGQRHFGENYVQELVEKATHPLLVNLDGICWNFIGHLQRNKCNNVLSAPHIWCVETVDSDRLATALDGSWGRKRSDPSHKLNVFVQVNTSGETSKSGCDPKAAVDIVRHIKDTCTNLEFLGLMTIGRFGHDYSSGTNPDFECLTSTRTEVCMVLGLNESDCELSMGMSADFEQAIVAGSSNVRVGTTIFGARDSDSGKAT